MEEILASIRKIIADDPGAAQHSLLVPLAPSVSTAATPFGDRAFSNSAKAPMAVAQPVSPSQTSLSARLNDVFGTAPANVEGRPLPSSRIMAARSAVDDDLGDLLADPIVSPTPESPSAKSVKRIAPGDVTPQVPEPFVTASQSTARALPSLAQTIAPMPVGRPKSEPIVLAAMPVAARHMPPAVAPEADIGPPASSNLSSNDSGRDQAPMSHPKAYNGTEAYGAADGLKLSLPSSNELELAPPSSRLLPASRPINFYSQSPAGTGFTPIYNAVAKLDLASTSTQSSPTAPVPLVIETASIISARDLEVSERGAVASSGPKSNETAQAVFESLSANTAPREANELKAVTSQAATVSSSYENTAVPVLATTPPDPSAEAVASALGALAAGLAASARTTSPEIVVAAIDVPSPKPEKPAIAEIPVQAATEPTTPTVSVLASGETFVSGVALTPMATSRAILSQDLEDQAAELLRPMLRQWLDTNMPRIVEKALRIEFAQPVDAGALADKPKA